MKRLFTLTLLMAPVLLFGGGHPLPDGNYILQIPEVDYEERQDQTGTVKVYTVTVTNTEYGTMLSSDNLGANSEWSTLFNPENYKKSVNITNQTSVPDPWNKIKYWFATVEDQQLIINGLWGICEAVLQSQLTATKQSNNSWVGIATNSFDARMPNDTRWKYTMEWSLSPATITPPSISPNIGYKKPMIEAWNYKQNQKPSNKDPESTS